MSLLAKAQECIAMAEELLYAGDHAGSLECALEAAKYVQLIKLLRQDSSLKGASQNQSP
jgi:hypothetical protein